MFRNITQVALVPAVDLTGKEGYAIKPDGNLTGATGDTLYGIVLTGTDVTDASVIATEGEIEAIVGEAVVAGDVLTGGAGGKLVKATVGMQFGFAIALDSGNANDFVLVKII